MNQNIKRVVLWSLVAIVIAVLAWIKFYQPDTTSAAPQKLDKRGASSNNIALSAKIIQYSSVSNTIFSSGTLLADEEVELMPEISGKVVKINFKEGSRVKKGELLVKLNDDDLQPQLVKAETRLRLLELTESRQSKLLEKQGISKQDYDIAVSEVLSQKAEISYIKALIEKTEIKAPFDGMIGLRNISEGAYITPSNIIAKMQKTDYLKVDFSIPQKYSDIIKLSNSLSFKVPPDTNDYKVSIVAFEPKVDDQTRTLKIRAKFNNAGEKFLPGSYCEVNFITAENDKSVMIPSIALVPDLLSEYVYVYKDGKAQKRNVRIGTRSDLQIEITDGLFPGDTLITSGIMQLRDGMEVNIDLSENQGI